MSNGLLSDIVGVVDCGCCSRRLHSNPPCLQRSALDGNNFGYITRPSNSENPTRETNSARKKSHRNITMGLWDQQESLRKAAPPLRRVFFAIAFTSVLLRHYVYIALYIALQLAFHLILFTPFYPRVPKGRRRIADNDMKAATSQATAAASTRKLRRPEVLGQPIPNDCHHKYLR